MRHKVFSRVRLLLTAMVATAALAVPATASAATVVNGDFETGTLAGWQLFNRSSGEDPAGQDSWYVYSGTKPPGAGGIESVVPPPAGNFAAVTSQGGPGLHILYQDVALEPYYTHQLSLIAYYRSAAPLITPDPETFGTDTTPNQQYRIDVINPAAPIDTVNPADILATVFATKTGDPQELGPTTFTADLTPFGGQTVRLRFAEADNQLFLAASTDNVLILSTPPSNAFVLGKPVLNKKKGTAKLPVTVPGPGTLTIADVKKTKKRVKAKTLAATAAGTLNLPVKPTSPARKTLKKKGRLKVKVAVTFTPTGGLVASVTRKLTLKLAPPK
jgi:hypothetical protein